jgi:hypothetical protein
MKTIEKYTITIALVFTLLWGVLPAAQKKKEYQQSPYWWQVRLVVDVTGEYNDTSGNNGFDGKYSFTAVVLGTLQEDEDDYIFVQAYQEIKDLRWNETVIKDNVRKSFDVKDKVNPEVTLNYVFKEKGVVSIDFDFQPVRLPVSNPILTVPGLQLRFPESAGDALVNTKDQYNSGIVSGSNRVTFPDKRIYDYKFTNHTFQWTWLEKNGTWKNRHDAAVKLAIVRMVK